MRRHSFAVTVISAVIVIFLIAVLVFSTMFSVSKTEVDRITAIENEIEGVEYETK